MGTWNLEPGTWNLEPGTRNPEPGTRNQEPGNLEPGTRNLEQFHTVAVLVQPIAVVTKPGGTSWWAQASAIERVACGVGALLFSSGVVHVAILLGTGASWDGPLSLRKAATFGLSFGLTLMNIVWVASFLEMSRTVRASLIGSFTAACALETVLVTMQAWRGVPSHFNLETTFDGLVARALAIGGAVLVAVISWLMVAAWRRRPPVEDSFRVAIRLGLSILVAAQLVGALMIARGMLLVFAGNPQAAYDTAGSLKPVHGVAMHGILVLPLLAYALSFVDWPEQRRLHIIRVASAAYVLLTIVIFVWSA